MTNSQESNFVYNQRENDNLRTEVRSYSSPVSETYGYEDDEDDSNLPSTTSENYSENQAFLNKLKEKFYNEVLLNNKDMLIDRNNLLVLFESKLIMRKFFWNAKNQSFDKIPAGVAKNVDDHEDEDESLTSNDNMVMSQKPELQTTEKNIRDDFSFSDYSLKQAFRNRLQEKFYEAVVLDGQDMLIDSDDRVILFESKLVMRKFGWNPKTQDFEKIPTGVVKKHRKPAAPMIKNEYDYSIQNKQEVVEQ